MARAARGRGTRRLQGISAPAAGEPEPTKEAGVARAARGRGTIRRGPAEKGSRSNRSRSPQAAERSGSRSRSRSRSPQRGGGCGLGVGGAGCSGIRLGASASAATAGGSGGSSRGPVGAGARAGGRQWVFCTGCGSTPDAARRWHAQPGYYTGMVSTSRAEHAAGCKWVTGPSAKKMLTGNLGLKTWLRACTGGGAGATEAAAWEFVPPTTNAPCLICGVICQQRRLFCNDHTSMECMHDRYWGNCMEGSC